MVESRCGICCSSCEYREQMHCAGCLQIKAPFWGEACPVKACCEDRALAHCGQCKDVPCALLTQFAYDPQQGDDGARIQKCLEWAKEEETWLPA